MSGDAGPVHPSGFREQNSAKLLDSKEPLNQRDPAPVETSQPTMRTVLTSFGILVASGVLASVAWADDPASVAGSYEVSYEEVSNNCDDVGMNLARGVIKLEARAKDRLVVNIERMPLMSGSVSKAGKFKAASKIDRTSIKGLDGKFSSAGRVDDGVLQMVFIAEYYVDKKPLCTQSWNVSGLRSDAAK